VILQECTDASWIISSPLELSIKKKIERLGTPLKEWDVNIYRGILTGYNEAFIIDGAKKDELIAADPRSEEIIKPILRGRDIKRYKAEFADLWLIATHNGYKTHSPLQSGGSVADGVSIPLLQRGGSVADGVFIPRALFLIVFICCLYQRNTSPDESGTPLQRRICSIPLLQRGTASVAVSSFPSCRGVAFGL
jgi:hypothetical protein